MGKYTVIADISNALVKLLQDNMVPEIVLNMDGIGLYAPYDKGDAVLGLYLYDIKESEEIRTTEMINQGTNRQKYPSQYLSLFYMLTAYSTTDVKFRAIDDQRILGKAMQVLSDNPVLDSSTFSPGAPATGQNVRIQLLALAAEDKYKLWNFPGLPYRLSLFYKVSPIELESERAKSVQRILDLEIRAEE